MSNDFDMLLQVANECVLNTDYAVRGYIDNNNLVISMQFMNQAFFCAKQIQNRYYQVCDHSQAYLIEQFYNQFLLVNQEFLDALQTDHSLQHSLLELNNLKVSFKEMKNSFIV